jgi:hypothetical protein
MGSFSSCSHTQELHLNSVLIRDVDEGLSFFVSNVDAIVDDVETIMLRAVVIANAHVWESSLRVATNTSNLNAFNVGVIGHTGRHVQSFEIAASRARTTVERDQVRNASSF